MRFINYLNEEYVTMWGMHTIFVNPNPKELKEACTNDLSKCRFFIDVDNTNLYVWDYRLLHEDASRALNKDGIHNKYPYNGTKEVWGLAKLIGAKLKVIELYLLSIREEIENNHFKQKIFYEKLKFTSRWMGKEIESYTSKEIKKWKAI